MTWKHILFALGYFAIFAATAVGMILWQRRQRKTRKPFGDDFKLLRGPGETQLKLTQKFDEEFAMWIVGFAMIPSTVALILLKVTATLPGIIQLGGVALTILGFAVSYYFAAKWLAAKLSEYGNRYLGYFGERIVAEHLDPLKQQGWRIFHDVPGLNNGTKFNIDHVAVGPQGVYVIETKTRRKGGARPGFDDHKVYFDGRSLVWPWGEDNHGLEQAEANAQWLAGSLKAEIGERVHVTPFLTLPGWWVENKPSRDSRICRLVNPKALPQFLSNGSTVLTSQQITAIAAKLEARCRDVEY
jgi:hypothetical protein